MVPPPRLVTLDRVLGNPISLLGYAPETTIAEKGVTQFSNAESQARAGATTSTSSSWPAMESTPMSYFARRGPLPPPRVTLEPIAPHLVGYGAVGQAKWAAWRRKEQRSQSAKRTWTNRSTSSSTSP